jgi:hypothetical protein
MSFIIQRERGIVLPVAAAFFLTLFLILAVLGFSTGKVKKVKTALVQQLDLDCREAAEELPIFGRALFTFAGNFGPFWNSPGNFIKGTSIESDDYVRLYHILNGPQAPLNSSFDIKPLDLPPQFADPMWKLDTNLVSQPGNFTSAFPAGFWFPSPKPLGFNENDFGFGSILGCEAQISTDAITLSDFTNTTYKAVAKVAYARVPRAGNGFVVAIAPEIPTTEELPRFIFHPSLLEHPDIDPLDDGIVAFQSKNTVNPEYDFSTLSAPESSKAVRNARLACMNPLIAARNILVSGIVGRLARSSFSRFATLLALVNPANEAGSQLWHWAHPAIVPMGADLAAPAYSLPLVDFVDGGGAIGLAPLTDPNRRYVRDQLRLCAHLYGDGPNYSTGCALPEDTETQNLAFEHTFVTPSLSLNPPGSPYIGGTNEWEYGFSGHNAQTIMTALGTIQGNPSGQYGVLNKPVDFDNHGLGLRGDFYGFFSRLEQAAQYPTVGPSSLAAKNARTILLVTHQPPSAEEISYLSTAVLSGGWLQDRLILVLYMPARKKDVSGYNDWMSAIHPAGYSGSNDVILLYPSVSDPGDADFRDYWHCLVYPESEGKGKCPGPSMKDQSAEDKARMIFNDFITELRAAL